MAPSGIRCETFQAAAQGSRFCRCTRAAALEEAARSGGDMPDAGDGAAPSGDARLENGGAGGAGEAEASRRAAG